MVNLTGLIRCDLTKCAIGLTFVKPEIYFRIVEL
jgi:hypothetical protein